MFDFKGSVRLMGSDIDWAYQLGTLKTVIDKYIICEFDASIGISKN
jgi:hypothetical protein